MKTRNRGVLTTIACAGSALLLTANIGFALPQDTATTTQKDATAESFPSPKELVDKWIRVSGGKANWEKVRSMDQKGTFSMPAMGIKGKVEILMQAPNLMRSNIEIPGIGTINEGFNGTTAWSINPMTGPTIKEGMELVQAKRSSSFKNQMDPLQAFESSKTIGKASFNGRECWAVEAKGKDGISKLFFDIETGMSSGMSMIADTPQGQLEVTVKTEDPKQFGELKLNSKMTISAMGQTQEITIESISYGAIDASKFDLPPAIETMVKAKEAKAKDSPKEEASKE